MATTRLLIARHGNTFAHGETPVRAGAHTDLDLVEAVRGKSLGQYLARENLVPDVVYAATLKRTTQTASQAVNEMGLSLQIQPDNRFLEIDYGPDEGKPEDEVIARIGQKAMDLWNAEAKVPEGWKVDPAKIIQTWQDVANEAQAKNNGKNTLIVSSNGIIRFAPHITGDFEGFTKENDIKVATGGLCIFEKNDEDENWHCTGWNLRPHKILNINQ